MSKRDMTKYTPQERTLARFVSVMIDHADGDDCEDVWKKLTSNGMGAADAIRVLELVVENSTYEYDWYAYVDRVASVLQMTPDDTEWCWETVQYYILFYHADVSGTKYTMKLQVALESMDFMECNHQHIRKFLVNPAAVDEEFVDEEFPDLAWTYREWAVANDEWDPENDEGDAAIEAMC